VALHGLVVFAIGVGVLPSQLPQKKEVLNKLLEQWSVMVHLDPRPAEVRVPSWFKKQPQLALQIGLNLPVPIRDLEIDDDGISCTLSFNRSPHFCFVPWAAVFALVGEDGRGMVWPESVPSEITLTQQAQAPRQGSGPASPAGQGKLEQGQGKPARGKPGRVKHAQADRKQARDSKSGPKRPGLTAVAGGAAGGAAPAEAVSAGVTALQGDAPAEPAIQPTAGQSTQKAARPSYLRVVK
jgi:stringent starvation protein B